MARITPYRQGRRIHNTILIGNTYIQDQRYLEDRRFAPVRLRAFYERRQQANRRLPTIDIWL
ncbi:hypothetical protein [Shewanella sp. NIFS-20-20]|uniref:hypothetical protein n=1 Tax=Shewanella sp. NIFS-20-20 TaxID=2853806 RepID=UPI001C487A65|nr:hypothetical protein [Shewanella sp. NIFS-20-20]MBV7316290.1 hypothetical protein [Shewanella sp. NIFS-20-20]